MGRKNATRGAIVGLASGVLWAVAAATGTATAADGGAGGTGPEGIVGMTYEVLESDYIAHLFPRPGGKDDGAPGGLIKVTTSDGRVLYAYCLDSGAQTKRGATYREADRSGVPTLKGNPDAAKIDWILRHGYPAASEDVLGGLIGVKLSKNAAAGGTQAAIWRLSNHVEAVPWDPAAAELADYLVAHAEDVEEPARPLILAPGTVTGTAGSLLGPIRISSTGDQVGVSLDPAAVKAGVALTDRQGDVLSDDSGKLTRPAKNGESLFVKAPADAGEGGATVSATADVPAARGRKLVSADSQALALLSGDRIPVAAEAKAGWTAAETSPSPTADPGESASSAPSGSPSGSASPTAPGTTTDPGTPGASAPASTPPTAGAATPSAAPEGSELASTGSGGALGFVATAAGGLAAIGGAVVLMHEYRRRFRTRD
ncbi:Cys-Gln thioester bond-forming surface protein [Streptomyces sp. NPDC012637]|uniref:Cys-Gln thioester bond-forming surface protein n=1 Tax=Streptomyces sp. NPDC012637 TaxID=3364842 RepID=UPI0036EB8980